VAQVHVDGVMHVGVYKLLDDETARCGSSSVQ
jgi:hypothetical protein